MVGREFGAQCISLRLSLSSTLPVPLDAGVQSGRGTKLLETCQTLSLELPTRLKQADLQTFPNIQTILEPLRSLGVPLATSGLLS